MPKVVVSDKKGLVQESGNGVFVQGGDKAGYIALTSDNGTVWYFFVEDDGTLKVHNAAPAANANGSAVGDQTD